MNLQKKIERKHKELLKLQEEFDLQFKVDPKIFENTKSYRLGVEYVSLGIYYMSGKYVINIHTDTTTKNHGYTLYGEYETKEHADRQRDIISQILNLKLI